MKFRKFLNINIYDKNEKIRIIYPTELGDAHI